METKKNFSGREYTMKPERFKEVLYSLEGEPSDFWDIIGVIFHQYNFLYNEFKALEAIHNANN